MMNTLRPVLLAASLGTALLTQPAPSLALTEDHAAAQLFATCAGRLSALVEHQWITDGPASEGTARLRDAHLALLEASTPPALAPLTLNWRIDAKVAQAGLLNLAMFDPDPATRAQARIRAEGLVADCTGLLLGQS